MSTRSFEDIAEAQGWSSDSVVGVLIDFIDNHADKAALIAYAEGRAADENETEAVEAVGAVRAPDAEGADW